MTRPTGSWMGGSPRGISRTTCLLMVFLATQFEDADGYFVGVFVGLQKWYPVGKKLGSPSNQFFFFRRTLLHNILSITYNIHWHIYIIIYMYILKRGSFSLCFSSGFTGRMTLTQSPNAHPSSGKRLIAWPVKGSITARIRGH